MRLTNAMREQVAKQVAFEKVEVRLKAKAQEIMDKGNSILHQTLSDFTERLEGLDDRYVPHMKVANFRVAGNSYVGFGQLDGVDDWTSRGHEVPRLMWRLPRKYRKPTHLNYILGGEQLKEINLLIGEYVEIYKDYARIVCEVTKFLRQFHTYKKALAEWSDLGNYLTPANDAKTVKKPGTSLMLPGAELNAFLGKFSEPK